MPPTTNLLTFNVGHRIIDDSSDRLSMDIKPWLPTGGSWNKECLPAEQLTALLEAVREEFHCKVVTGDLRCGGCVLYVQDHFAAHQMVLQVIVGLALKAGYKAVAVSNTTTKGHTVVASVCDGIKIGRFSKWD